MMNVISTAANQYYNRPADERYDSPQDLLNFSAARKLASREVDYNAKDLIIRPSETQTGAIQIQSPRGAANLTPWSHAQLCRFVGAPGGYIKTLPADVQADALNFGLRKTTPGTTARILAERKDDGSITARAVTSESYGRLWDSEWLAPIVSHLVGREGWTTPPTWDGKPAGAYSSDRDSFLIVVNGGSIVTDPSVRNGSGQMYRGLMLRNSEVGAAAYWMEEVLFQFVCGNHNLWGAVIGQQYRRRHVGSNVLRDVLRTIGSLARRISTRPASADETIIRSLIDLEVASTQQGVIDELRKMGATQEDAAAAYDRCVRQFDASPRSYWGIAQGLTAASQDTGYQDERLTLDQLAAKVLQKGKARIAVAA